MRKVDDPGTQAAISTLIFQHEIRDASSTDEGEVSGSFTDSDQVSPGESSSVEHEDPPEGKREKWDNSSPA